VSEPVLGIDLGTSNTVLATVEDGVPLVIPSRAGGWLTPSMVACHEGQYLVGRAAREVLDWFPQRVATATKRYIGQRYSEELADAAREKLPYRIVSGPTGDIRVSLDGQVLPLTQVSALVLGELYLDAQRYFGRPVRKAVITVPANFDDGQRQATKEAAQIAGFELLRIINEPTAAALAFGLARQFTGRALVFDLGGGTLDVTVLEVSDGVFEVKATGGHPQLGGEDFDALIMGWMLDQLSPDDRALVEKDPISLRRLRTAAEQTKLDLTETESAWVHIAGLGHHGTGKVSLDATLERRVFDQLAQPLWDRCIGICDQVLRDAKLTPDHLQAVLMVGGMTRVPRIRTVLTERLGRAPETGVSPDEVVALGAAIQGSQIGTTTGETLLLDVASQSLGVGFATQRVRRLIGKNAAIPTRAQQCFLPVSTKQSEAVIPIYQGESDYGTHCTRLGELRLTGLRGGDRSEQPILVTFELAADGTLSVSTQHPNTGEVTTLQSDARTDLSSDETGKLTKEQAARMAAMAGVDKAAGFEAFSHMLDELQDLLGSSEAASWGDREREAVSRLLGVGRDALASDDWVKVATLTRGFPRLVKAARRGASGDGNG